MCNEEKSCPYCGHIFEDTNPIIEDTDTAIASTAIVAKKQKKLRPLFLVLTMIIILGGITTFVVLNLNNNLKKAKNYYISKDFDAFVEIEKKMSEEEKMDFAEYLEKDVEHIGNDYSNDTITYAETKEKMDTLMQFAQDLPINNYKSTTEKINALHSSQSSYKEAIKKERKGDYEDAILLYKQVIEEDSNYSDTQEKLITVKAKLVDDYTAKAIKNAQEEKYESALDYLETALFYVGSTSTSRKTLLALQEEYTQKKEEQSRKKALLTKKKEIKTSNINAQFKNAKITSEIYPDDTSGFYMYYKSKDTSEVYLDIQFKLKNSSSTSIELEKLISDITVLYDGKEKVISYGSMYSSGSSIDTVERWSTLSAGKEVTFHFLIILPTKLSESDAPLEVEFYLDGERQILVYR
ncbi:hypothetical protein [Anaerosporobacter sp.]|uniref:hypothetical protein n=1 Tax=Anaerosporobacter sp. TaxID=1872529 RepID=UPI00286F93ED|nr:hypothetical protein [Anaerosporobacter sp.]